MVLPGASLSHTDEARPEATATATARVLIQWRRGAVCAEKGFSPEPGRPGFGTQVCAVPEAPFKEMNGNDHSFWKSSHPQAWPCGLLSVEEAPSFHFLVKKPRLPTQQVPLLPGNRALLGSGRGWAEGGSLDILGRPWLPPVSGGAFWGMKEGVRPERR